MSFYIKKLGKQELGSDSGARGRYIYISKFREVLSFFPQLGNIIKNDMSVLSVINMSLDPTVSIYCSYVFHNRKTAKEKPNPEYRMYLNSDIDPRGQYFNVGDIVVFQKVEEQEYTYQLYKFTSSDDLYSQLNDIVNASSIQGNHAFVDNIEGFVPIHIDIEEILDSNLNAEVNSRVNSLLSENEILFDDEEIASGAHLFNSKSFRKYLLDAYEKLCAVTGNVIEWETYNNLEAAHIKPKAHNGPYLPSNGICMSKDMHWAFDKGFFTVDPEFRICVHEAITNPILLSYNGKQITVPEDSFAKPKLKYLEHHASEVFGSFLSRGQIRSL